VTGRARVFAVLILAMAVPAFAAAQDRSKPQPARGAKPAAAPAPSPGSTAAETKPTAKSEDPKPPATADQLIEPSGFAYKPEGRRDPFVSLLRRGTDARASTSGSRPPGLAGLGVSEVTLRGTLYGREGFVAILQGADQKTYIVRPGDRLFDGTVRAISQKDMVIVQQVNDPLSLEKQREVRKVLRQVEAN
jgi:Tfp pilus assembly protein PilP